MLKQLNQYYELCINYGTYQYVVFSRNILLSLYPNILKDANNEQAYAKLLDDWQSGELAL